MDTLDQALPSNWEKLAAAIWQESDLPGDTRIPIPSDLLETLQSEWLKDDTLHELRRRIGRLRNNVKSLDGMRQLDTFETAVTNRGKGKSYDASTITSVFDLYDKYVPEKDMPHPLTPLILAWQRYAPERGLANWKPDAWFPSMHMLIDPSDSRAGKLFTPSNHLSTLPGFDYQRTARTPVMPLAFYEMGNPPQLRRQGGRGVPFPQRLYIRAVRLTPYQNRKRDNPFEMRLTMRQIRDTLYNTSKVSSAVLRDALLFATRTINSMDVVHWRDEDTQQGGFRQLVWIRNTPEILDDELIIVTNLPPSMAEGPPASPRLDQYGASNKRAYYALLHLPFTWWEPGKTRIPNKYSGGRYKSHPDWYNPLSDSDIVAIVHPTERTTPRNAKISGLIASVKGNLE